MSKCEFEHSGDDPSSKQQEQQQNLEEKILSNVALDKEVPHAGSNITLERGSMSKPVNTGMAGEQESYGEMDYIN